MLMQSLFLLLITCNSKFFYIKIPLITASIDYIKEAMRKIEREKIFICVR